MNGGRLRFVQFNVENLFVLLDHYKGQDLEALSEGQWQSLTASTVPLKPLGKLRRLRDVIFDLDPDYLMLNEVGGIESLTNFNHHFLQDRFEVYLYEGNSSRGIDVGYLVKKDLPYKHLLFTHKNRPIHFLYPHEKSNKGRPSHLFSRDVAELRVFAPDGHSPLFVVLLTHLKSKLDPEGIDPEGRLRRQAELKTLVALYNELQTEFEKKVPILVCGDFNGCAQAHQCDAELSEIYAKTDLRDALEVADIPHEKRITQIRISSWQNQKYAWQLDYVFLSPHLHQHILLDQTFVYRFKDSYGLELPLPSNEQDVFAMPSDHYPVVVTLKNFLS